MYWKCCKIQLMNPAYSYKVVGLDNVTELDAAAGSAVQALSHR